MNILLLSNRPSSASQAATVVEYLDAFSKYSNHNIFELSMLNYFPDNLDLNKFDVIITHYSLSLGPLMNHYLGGSLIKKLINYNGLKVSFLQDEYRSIQTYWEHINLLKIDLLFSCVPETEIHKVYPENKVPNLKVVNVLTGYVPEQLLHRNVAPVADRPIDVGYRTRVMPYWLGRLGYEKWWISQEFIKRSKDLGLKLDLSVKEGERLYGEAWNEFIASCRCVLGVESGASIIDYDGNLERSVDEYVSKNSQASFDEVFELFLKPYEGTLNLHQISPRCFEAAALRTPMILFEGNYSGILQADRHYISLKKDFSNFDKVVSMLQDSQALQKMADLTYKEIALNINFSYENFVKKIDYFMEKEVSLRKTLPAQDPYTINNFDAAVKSSFRYYWRRKFVLLMQHYTLGNPFIRKVIFSTWQILPIEVQRKIRPFARFISK